MDWSNFTIGYVVGAITAAVYFWWVARRAGAREADQNPSGTALSATLD
jgi:hypothetical protein